jgi:hypothetical protein
VKKWIKEEKQGTEKRRKLKTKEIKILRKLRKTCKKKAEKHTLEERKQVKKRMYGARCGEKRKGGRDSNLFQLKFYATFSSAVVFKKSFVSCNMTILTYMNRTELTHMPCKKSSFVC